MSAPLADCAGHQWSRGWALAVLLALEATLLFAASWFGDFTVPGNARAFVALMWGAGIAFAGAVTVFARNAALRPVAIFWAMAILLRLVMLGCAPADDFWRYAWEGRIQNEGFNPYLFSPSAPELEPLRDSTWARINHPESAAIYPPATELVFAALASISTSPLAFKIAFAAADLAALALLLQLVGGANRYHRVAWYAWNPAVAYAFCGAGHYDSLMLVTLTASLVLLRNATRADRRGWMLAVSSSALMGLAIAFKLIPIFLLPAWCLALRRHSVALIVALLVPLGLSLWYGGVHVVLRPFRAFADVTRFHDLVWWFIEAVTIPNPWQRNWPFSVALAVGIVVVTWQFRNDWQRAALWILGLALLLSPVLHPWYATWILPLAVWRQAPAWTALSISALASLLLWETTGLWTAWQPNLLTRTLVILPPAAVWILHARRPSRLIAS